MNLQSLLAERAITRNIMALARSMDARDWEGFAQLIAPEIEGDFGAGEVRGSERFVAHIRSYLDKCGATQHLIGNVVVDVEADRAVSRAYVCDMHLSKAGDDELQFRTLGEYCDEWSLRDERWLLVRRVKDNRATLGSMAVFQGEQVDR